MKLPTQFGEDFRFLARNEHAAVHGHFQAAKRRGADDVLQWFAPAAALDEFTKAVHFRPGEHALEVEIEPHPGKSEQVRQQQFGLQPRRLDTFHGQELRAFLDDL